jgi:hypothetical protein
VDNCECNGYSCFSGFHNPEISLHSNYDQHSVNEQHLIIMVETIEETPQPPTPGQQSGKTPAILDGERARVKAAKRAAGRIKALATKKRAGSESYKNLYGSRVRVYKPKTRVPRFKDGEEVKRRRRKAGSSSVIDFAEYSLGITRDKTLPKRHWDDYSTKGVHAPCEGTDCQSDDELLRSSIG